MKLSLRIAGALALLAIVGVAVALLALPRLLDGESARGRIEQAARDNLGRELRYESLDFGFLPPSLRVVKTTVSGETAEDAPLLEAREIALRVALLPLLFGTVVVDSLVIEGATLRLTRTTEGLELPRPDASDLPDEPAAGADTEAEPSSGVDLAVRSVRLRDTSLHLIDRAVRPPVSWELREIEATASGTSIDGPIELVLEAALGSGGRLKLEGTATRAGDLDLAAQLDDVVLAPLASYLEEVEIAGTLAGSARIAGPAAALARLEADLHGDLRFRRGDVALRGAVVLRADVTSPTGDVSGSFDLDATRAELEVGGGFTKPVGTPARVTGRIAPADGGGLAFEDVKLVIKNLEATGRVSSLAPVSATLDAEPFDLQGWETLVPALSGTPPRGRLRLEGLRYRADPPDLRGSVKLENLVLQAPDAAPIAISGLLRAEGEEVASEGLIAETAGQTLRLDVRLESLFGNPRYRLDVKADAADANALVTTLLSKPDTLYGPLALDASFRGDATGALPGLNGRIDFGVEQGRLVGVSILRAVFDRFGAAGGLLLELGKDFGGRDLQRFYGDEFQLLTGVLDIADGVARTDDLTFLYRGYGVKLRGTLGLADLSLDMRGDLTLLEEIDRELAEQLKLPDDYVPRQRNIRLAAVRGTLDDPKVRLAPGAANDLLQGYIEGRFLGDARGKVEEVLGEGSGDLVDQGFDILQGILGGGGKKLR